MEERTFRRTRFAGLLAAATMVAVACSSGAATSSPAGSAGASAPAASDASRQRRGIAGPGRPELGGEVSVIGTWTGAEQDSFLAMVAPWEDRRPASRSSTPAQRDLNAVLTTGVASGNLPDLAGLPGPGQMADFARAGALKPLDDVLDIATYKADTSAAFVELGTVDGKIVGHLHQGAVKGLIWYNPKVCTGGEPTTWDELAKGRGGPAAGATPSSGASASSPAPTPAGRARTGSRTSSSARPVPTSTTVGRGHDQVDVAGDQGGIRVVRRRPSADNAYGGPNDS